MKELPQGVIALVAAAPLFLLHYLKTHKEMKARVEEGKVDDNTKQEIHNL
jgi:hypothetical protein